ncbi:uncharacterized protein EV420DRAFT_1711847 [Desarmillaria tabescens]|uniref:Uncharacterized protein n=1 Tax=Armillaria tabescens TaxID=1929756 RepID=A0AA39MVT3_ARMTA|nr:uncharacterized protein EV420DRAFT_1711847 [Desarmillaria tabescens]KAK0448487.1 hypothetical protein EV420DRAFT_1711847 [Desarmillaria tabescens]
MAAQTDFPPGLTEAAIHQLLDYELNSGIFYFLLHGIYTGVLAVTLWSIYISKSQPIRRGLVIVTIVLYITTSINVAITWSSICSAFIDHGQNLWTKYFTYAEANVPVETLGAGIVSTISTILADSTMIWRCWQVWGQCWLIVLIPILCLFSGVVCNILVFHQEFLSGFMMNPLLQILYISFSLATTLFCTLLIIYRIWRVGQINNGGLRVYGHMIEVLVESAALFSISLILYVVLDASNSSAYYYIDRLAAILRGVTPTLLIGRIVAGHARPDDSWQGSIASSLNFRPGHSQTSSQEDSMISINLSDDLEAQQPERNVIYEHPLGGYQEDVRQRVMHGDNMEALPEEVDGGSDMINDVIIVQRH